MVRQSELKALEAEHWHLAHKSLKATQELLLADPSATAVIELQLAELEIKRLERRSKLFGDLNALRDDLMKKWDLVAPVEHERDLIEEKGAELERETVEVLMPFARPWIDGTAEADLERLKERARAPGRVAEETEYQKLLAARWGASVQSADSETARRVNPERSYALRHRRCDPRLWRCFNYEKTSKASTFREFLIYNFVSLSVPAHRTNRDVVQEIARESHIPIESLPDELKQPVYPRGQAIFGFAGDEFDKIAYNYDNMQWWLSDTGLNMAIVGPANPAPLTFDELVGGLSGERAADFQRRATEAQEPPRKGDISLLRKADGSLYESVDYPTAERYAEITSRRRQQLTKAGTLDVVGMGQNRRVTVQSLIAYCPPTEGAK